MVKLTLAYGGDWEGFYLDNKLIADGHVVTATEILEKLGYSVDSVEVNQEWLESRGNLPENMEEVVED